ncbi:hypothetical protein NLS1_06700 [Nocardioides sp. LS1]|nr:hypothetical protein NLS1_06700 [Nocardioides sp. LS1]
MESNGLSALPWLGTACEVGAPVEESADEGVEESSPQALSREPSRTIEEAASARRARAVVAALVMVPRPYPAPG